MLFKVVKKGEFREVTGNYTLKKAWNAHIHRAADVNEGVMTMGEVRFEPGGGAEWGSNIFETIYHIVEGQLYFECETEAGEKECFTLYAGDSFHCGPDTKKSFVNNGDTDTVVYAILAKVRR